jgi:urea transport system permease protein
MNLGFLHDPNWVDWWLVLLGLSFVAVTLFAPKGIGGLFDLIERKRTPDRTAPTLGPPRAASCRRGAAE